MVSVILAEKPSVARDIASALEVTSRKQGYFEGTRYIITWAIGHLVRIADPHEINREWKSWRLESLPMIPQNWPLEIQANTSKQFDIVKKLLNAKQTKEVICATDSGREGELIFRLIYEKSGCSKPIKRLWISSLTKSSIRNGFDQLKDGSHYDQLADCARGRSRADWLIGMNLSRIYSILHHDVYSIGRVQTPTLSMLVDRDLEIKNFKPEKYEELKIIFDTCNNQRIIKEPFKKELTEGQFIACYINEVKDHATFKLTNFIKERRFPDKSQVLDAVLERIDRGCANIIDMQEKKQILSPPQFYDLTELQRHANRIYSFSAKKTLDLAQNLYEKHKSISYPRTDCRYISKQEEQTLSTIVKNIKSPYELLIRKETGSIPLDSRYVNCKQVTEHHAIIPTGQIVKNLTRDEYLIYDLICRRLLAAWQDPYKSATTTVIIEKTCFEEKHDSRDYFVAKGTRILQNGWKILEENLTTTKKETRDKEVILPKSLSPGQQVFYVAAKRLKGTTRPPTPMNEARLLTGMETAGSQLEDKDLSQAMKGSGLGTPATRASIIESLEKRKFIRREGKHLRVTDKGFLLISKVEPELKSPQMTGEWESQLEKIRSGEISLLLFMEKIESHLKKLISKIMNMKQTERNSKQTLVSSPTTPLVHSSTDDKHQSQLKLTKHTESLCSEDLESVLKDSFGLNSFRGPQKNVCQKLIQGHNILLVMPTGAGKSLCFQLPGAVRQGTSLIISPLIALMEDHVSKLTQNGFSAECIHSGRNREESREICRLFLKGHLDYLFVSPERLALPGFIDLLLKKKLSLIAIDEAHCISQWGHDFRFDYRKLGERLSSFNGVPKIALTATATKEVQKDIIKQLSMNPCKQFIAGFRRDNLQLEVFAVSKSERLSTAISFLKDSKNRPAIVYTLTRKETDRIAKELNTHFVTKSYHAGQTTQHRQSVQNAFMGGEIDIVVATVAFGMGIDKQNIRSVVHMALPSTLAGYYQEIGRGGRDGLDSRAILLYSYADQKTHLFLHEVNYPDINELRKVFDDIPQEGIDRNIFLNAAENSEACDTILQKLWIHGAITYGHDFKIYPLSDNWETSYKNQKERKKRQLESVWNFARESTTCRMVQLIRYFGDTDDTKKCNRCDICSPEDSSLKSVRTPSHREKLILNRMWEYFSDRKNWSRTSLFQHVSKKKVLVDRETFDILLGSLLQAGYLSSSHASFKKEGRLISYEQLSLPPNQVTKAPSTWDDLRIIH